MKKILLIFAMVLAFNSCIKFEVINQDYYIKNAQISDYMRSAYYYYLNATDYTDALKDDHISTNMIGNNLDLVRYYFRSALDLDPKRLDIAYSLANTYIFLGDTEKALETFSEILKKNKKEVNALVYSIFYNYALGRINSVDMMIKNLKRINSKEATLWASRLASLQNINKTYLNISIKKDYTIKEEEHVIVLMGYALDKDGNMNNILKDRLKTTLDVHFNYPNSKIIVSGAVPKQGFTEAGLMRDWLISKGVKPELIIVEDRSHDTVGNAFYSIKKIKELPNIKKVTLVSSASHMRRCLNLFTAAVSIADLTIDFSNAVAMDYMSEEDMYNINKTELLAITRDTLRSYGLSPFPSLSFN